jgi:hypothetical protein
MRKRNLQKAVVLVVCFAFLGLSASGLSADENKPIKLSFSLLFKKPGLFLVTLIPGLRPIIGDQPAQVQPGTSNSTKTILPTGTIKVIRLSGGD